MIRSFDMSYITITTERNETYSSISNFFIDYYMTSANGEYVKIYLYLVRLMSSREPVSIADIADHFNLTEKAICSAIKYWISQDVMRLEYNNRKELTGITLLPLHAKAEDGEAEFSDGLSILAMDYSAEDTQSSSPVQASEVVSATTQKTATVRSAAGRTHSTAGKAERQLPDKIQVTPEYLLKKQEDEVISDLLFETEAYFGRPLSMPETEILIYIHDQLGFSQELMEYLIEYCVTRGKLSCKYAEAVAKAWYEKGIDTVDRAKEDSASYNPFYRKIFDALGIRSYRPVTNIESAYIDAWTGEMNFSEEIILLACEKAVITRPQSANFAYVNGILENWHRNGVHTIRDVETLDQEFMKKKVSGTPQQTAPDNPNGFANFRQTDMSDQLDQLEQMFADALNLDKKTS